VTDRIAGEASQCRHPVGHVRPPDRAQGEQVVEGEREIAAGDACRRERDRHRVHVAERVEHVLDLDPAQVAKQRDRRNCNNGDADQEADPVPADRLLAESQDGAQGFEGRLAAIRWLRLHRVPVAGWHCDTRGLEH
jgi:hypothetical protein